MTLLVDIFFIALAWMSVQCGNQRDKVFFLRKSSDNEKLLVVLTWTGSENDISAGCEILTDRDLIDEALKSSGDADILTFSEDQLQDILRDCTEFNQRRRRRGTRERKRKPSRRVSNIVSTLEVDTTTETPAWTSGYDRRPFTFPGTKWCGAGDRARNDSDLGRSQYSDNCCRAHDMCDDILAPGETKNNLTNNSPITKLSCECDQDFYDCLNRVNSFTSNTIGNVYFNVLENECYKLEYPETKICKEYRSILKLKCREYERDTTKPKSYQWIPAKPYKRPPSSYV